MKEESIRLIAEIKDFIEGGSDSDDAFGMLALKLFRYQYENNVFYKKFCQAQRKTPITVHTWEEIPPMPVQGFKDLTLTCEPPEEAEAVFMTSGTTNPDAKGENYHPDLSLWDLSMKDPFKKFVLPDQEKIAIFVLSPSDEYNKNSSLSRYLTNAVFYYGNEYSRFFHNGESLDFQGAAESLGRMAERGEPVLIMGATFAFVHFLDYMKEMDQSLLLADGSRIFDTGGFKGQAREITPEEMTVLYERFFGIEKDMQINMYGMTELSSQNYDQTILSRHLGRQALTDKSGPAWLKTRILHPGTLEPVKEGEAGVLAHYDLANWNSCLAVLTEDLGVKTGYGFKLLGRVKGSEARGCSIAADQLLSRGGR
ncbi:CoF synthetase [Bacillus infantis]|uniref:LuxE/PaaK family acyltransferase n=1 Tax=Bacillus infantis TaxID=324767 RepID=UPI003CF4129F